MMLEKNLTKVRDLHVDSGWFIDGDKFDFYSAWSLQFYPLFWAQWDGNDYPSLRDEFYYRNDLFLQSYPHIFSRQGWMPMWGRSLCYRFAASSPLAVAFMRPGLPAIDPGFARRLCSGNLLQFLQNPDFLLHGIPSLGFYGQNPELVDSYSCVASPFWCAKLFMALLLAEDNPFWTARENEGFWSDPPPRFEMGKTGIWVEHDRDSGHTKLQAKQKARLNDHRYNAVCFDTSDVEWHR
jgi:hypothetical protein